MVSVGGDEKVQDVDGSHVCVPACSMGVQLLVTLRTLANQSPLSMGFSRQEYWGRLSFPSPRGSSPLRGGTCLSCIAGRFLTTESSPGKPPDSSVRCMTCMHLTCI